MDAPHDLCVNMNVIVGFWNILDLDLICEAKSIGTRLPKEVHAGAKTQMSFARHSVP